MRSKRKKKTTRKVTRSSNADDDDEDYTITSEEILHLSGKVHIQNQKIDHDEDWSSPDKKKRRRIKGRGTAIILKRGGAKSEELRGNLPLTKQDLNAVLTSPSDLSESNAQLFNGGQVDSSFEPKAKSLINWSTDSTGPCPNMLRPAGSLLQSSQIKGSESWVMKHSPCSEKDLVVHKKKVTEIRGWLQHQISHVSWATSGSRVLLLTGPAGTGKSATISMLAKELGCEVIEWNTPVPTLWNEHLHQGSNGFRYVSKLDEFDEFLDVVKKFPTLSLSRVQSENGEEQVDLSEQSGSITGTTGGLDNQVSAEMATRFIPAAHKILVIRDLPLAGDWTRRQRLAETLYKLAVSAKFPVVVILTDASHKGKCGDFGTVGTHGVEAALKRGGAYKITLNPVTSINIGRVLTRVAAAEGIQLAPEVVRALSEGSQGDLRHAICSLQFHCLGLPKSARDLGSGKKARGAPKKGRSKGPACASGGQHELNSVQKSAMRDNILSLYHLLGKLLHNKRHVDAELDTGKHVRAEISQHLQRNPLNMDDPEVIIGQAKADMSKLATFLHENVLDFVAEEGIESVADMAAFFSDADLLLSARGSFHWSERHSWSDHAEPDPSRTSVAAAASVVARGVLFANVHPVPSKWQALRSPAVWQVEYEQKKNLSRRKEDIWSSGPAYLSNFKLFSRDYLENFPHSLHVSDVDAFYKYKHGRCIKLDENSTRCVGFSALDNNVIEDDIEDPDL